MQNSGGKVDENEEDRDRQKRMRGTRNADNRHTGKQREKRHRRRGV